MGSEDTKDEVSASKGGADCSLQQKDEGDVEEDSQQKQDPPKRRAASDITSKWATTCMFILLLLCVYVNLLILLLESYFLLLSLYGAVLSDNGLFRGLGYSFIILTQYHDMTLMPFILSYLLI